MAGQKNSHVTRQVLPPPLGSTQLIFCHGKIPLTDAIIRSAEGTSTHESGTSDEYSSLKNLSLIRSLKAAFPNIDGRFFKP